VQFGEAVVCAANQQPDLDAAWRCFGCIPQPDHDRVAGTIEAVISRHSLAMFRSIEKPS
jgi:hypothetical protein